MYEAMAYANMYFQIILAVSAPHGCQEPTSLVGGIHWLNRVVPCFIRFDYCRIIDTKEQDAIPSQWLRF